MFFSLISLFLFSILSTAFTLFIILFATFRIIVQLRRNAIYSEPTANQPTKSISFFHPNCLSGGGGERVLWIGIECLLKKFNHVRILVHTADQLCFDSPTKALDQISERFGIKITDPERISFSSIQVTSFLLQADCYPVLTLLGQFLGGLICSMEALCRYPTDIIVDTTGCAALIIPWKLYGQAQIVSYVHYPTISASMLERVANPTQNSIYNNADWIRESQVFTHLKMYYYNIFAGLYGFFGGFSDVTMTNSSWTQNHIKSLWGGKPKVVFPPCDTGEFSSIFELEDKPGQWIISIGQFRPEKDHRTQLASFARFLRSQKDVDACKLLLVGGCRDEGDRKRVDELKHFAEQLGIAKSVEFYINCDFSTLKQMMSHCTINLHTMLEEHFGIGVVEGMAAGLVTVANASGGPLTDIIGPKKCLPEESCVGVGFLCSTEEEYANTFDFIFNRLPRDQLEAIRRAGKERACEMFTNEIFELHWAEQFAPLLAN